MILIGQYDSPFVRRVGIALRIYGIAYEHRPWSVFTDADRLRAISPLCRVPTLILTDGTVLLDSAAILDHLDDLVGADAALLPVSQPARTAARRRRACAVGVCEKAVALVYERLAHDTPSAFLLDRVGRQIVDTLGALEAERARETTPFFFGSTAGHDDIALACAAAFLSAVHPELFAPQDYPALAAHASRCEATAAFQDVRQDFVAPRVGKVRGVAPEPPAFLG